ncbi:MAG: hypothetical protein ACOYK9_02620 [Chlamydiia bacterium]
MFIEKDPLLGHLLAAAIELMVGEKALITHAGSCPHGFYADVYPPFSLGEGYFTPLKDHIKSFLKERQVHFMEMHKKNAVAFLLSVSKKRMSKRVEAGSAETVRLIRVHNYVAIFPSEVEEIPVIEDFSLDAIIPLDRGGFRILGHRQGVEPKKNFHLDHLSELGIFFQGEFLFNRQGLECKNIFLGSFFDLMKEARVEVVDTGPFGKETFKRVKEMGFSFATQVIESDFCGEMDPFSGWKGLSRVTTDRFFHLAQNEKVKDTESSCLRLIEKWTKILGIRGNFTERDRGRISWMVQDPYGTIYEGPFVERHPSGCLTGSLMGPLELMIAIHAEEKFTWNLENQESMSKSAFHKFV